MTHHIDPSTLNITAFAPISGHFGYGVHARNTLLAMIPFINQLEIVQSSPLDDCLCDSCCALKRHLSAQSHIDNPDANLAILPPFAFHTSNAPSFIFTTVESLVTHPSALRSLAPWDHVIVPSTYSANSLVRAGMPPSYISIVPEGINPILQNATPSEPTSEPIFSTAFPAPAAIDKPRILYIGDYSTRKCIREMVYSWASSWSKTHPSCLSMFVSLGGRRDPHALAEMRQETAFFIRQANPAALPDFHLTSAFIKPEDQLAFYRTAHIYLHLGRGEAWNLTLAEAHAAGLLCIALNQGGHRDFLVNDDWLPVQTLNPTILDMPPHTGTFHHRLMPFPNVDVADAALQIARACDIVTSDSLPAPVTRTDFMKTFSWPEAGRKIADAIAARLTKGILPCQTGPFQPYSWHLSYPSQWWLSPY